MRKLLTDKILDYYCWQFDRDTCILYSLTLTTNRKCIFIFLIHLNKIKNTFSMSCQSYTLVWMPKQKFKSWSDSNIGAPHKGDRCSRAWLLRIFLKVTRIHLIPSKGTASSRKINPNKLRTPKLIFSISVQYTILDMGNIQKNL